MEKVHEPSYIMVLPLLVLCIGSIFVGYIFKDLYVGLGTDTWLNCLFIFSNNIVYFNAEFLPF